MKRLLKPQLSLGVIGHVDHGKTSLVKALSGIDTDRLREEKERGMSIVLGFAYLDLDEGVIDLIDVPGHENFIRTMISGATGIDAALLVVDANEGIKPQTIEHLAITELVGVRRGLVAVTKCDLASTEARAVVLTRLRSLLKGTCLEFAPRIFTSVRTGEGLEELRRALKNMLGQRTSILPTGQFWLAIDRAFSIAGHGTVVTGTVRLGRLNVGDEVEIMPQGRRAIIRQIEVHGIQVEQAQPGQRAGINLRHVKAHEIERGDALASIGLLRASPLLDAQITLLKSVEKPLHSGQTLRLLFGTTDVSVRIRLLSGASVNGGDTGVVQFLARRPVSAVASEPFILRRDSPPMTIGGGRFLDPVPVRHRRSDSDAVARLHVLAAGSGDEVLTERLKAAGFGGMPLAALAAALGRPESHIADAAAAGSAIIVHDKTVLYKPFLDALGDMLLAALEKFHRHYPMRHGAPLSYCRASLPQTVSESSFKFVLQELCTARCIELGRGLARVSGYDPLAALSDEDRRLAVSIETSFRQGGVTPPDVIEVVKGDTRREGIFYLLVERGNLLHIQGEQPGRKIAFHSDVVRQVDRCLEETYPPPAQFTVSEVRALLGSTRKFTVPLLEHFDVAGYTRRRGDKRMVIREEERRR